MKLGLMTLGPVGRYFVETNFYSRRLWSVRRLGTEDRRDAQRHFFRYTPTFSRMRH